MSSNALPQCVEVQARNLYDVGFKYNWTIDDYLKGIGQGSDVDSPLFEVSFLPFLAQRKIISLWHYIV